MDMFTRDEGFSFLKNNLKIIDAEEKMKRDKKSLLDEFVIKMQTELLFTNFRLLEKHPSQRGKPSMEEIKTDLLSGVGGLCYNLNSAAYFLLKSIGFSVELVHATCTSTVLYPNNHIIVYVSNVEKPGDKFIVEVGFGFPTFRAVSLDFEKESPEFIDSFIEYKYIKHDGQLLRMHRKGDLAQKLATCSQDGVHFFLDGWRRFYYAEPNGTKDFTTFDEVFDQVFKNPKATPFHSSFRVIGFPNKKAVMVVNEKTLIENDNGELVPSAIEGGDEGIIEAVKRLFPVMPEALARNALTQWRNTTKS